MRKREQGIPSLIFLLTLSIRASKSLDPEFQRPLRLVAVDLGRNKKSAGSKMTYDPQMSSYY